MNYSALPMVQRQNYNYNDNSNNNYNDNYNDKTTKLLHVSMRIQNEQQCSPDGPTTTTTTTMFQ